MSVENPHKIDTSKLDEIIQSYDCKKSNLIAILQKVQEVYRYLPEEALIYIGTKIEGLSPVTVLVNFSIFLYKFLKKKYVMEQLATYVAQCLF